MRPTITIMMMFTWLGTTSAEDKKITYQDHILPLLREKCASCHNPDNAHAQTNDLSVQLGGPNLDQPGFRAVPSLRYLNLTPAFFFAPDGTRIGQIDGRVPKGVHGSGAGTPGC